MTDHPGWALPGSPEPPRDAVPPSWTAPLPPAEPGSAAIPEPSAPAATPSAEALPPGPPAGTPSQAGSGAAPGPYGGSYGGGHPQPGWGPPPGWGAQPGPGRYPGWGPPASPKPGVIPLRPLAVGEILDGAVSAVRKHWRSMLGLSLGIAAVQQGMLALGQWWMYDHPSDPVSGLAVLTPYALASVLAVLSTGLLTVVVSKAAIGQQANLRTAWNAARPQLGRLVGLTLLLALIAVVVVVVAVIPAIALIATGSSNPGLILLAVLFALAGLVVLVWLLTLLSLAAPALMLENQGVIKAMSRSRRLVRGAWWRQFGINLLAQLLTGVVASMLSLPFLVAALAATGTSFFNQNAGGGMFATMPPLGLLITAIGGTLTTTLTIPTLAAVRVLLYIDQRIRREALDLELARAAGLPAEDRAAGTGPTVPPQAPPPGA